VSDGDSSEDAPMQPSSPGDDERHETLYFKYSATLRIFGTIPVLDQITQSLGVTPTHTHRKGDRIFLHRPSSPVFEHDHWSYESSVDENEKLHVHIDALWEVFKDRREYLVELKKSVTVDVFLGYRSNCDNAGVDVPHRSLDIFAELQVPFALSIIVV
jgi:Domain of unknown function (DUF4279)